MYLECQFESFGGVSASCILLPLEHCVCHLLIGEHVPLQLPKHLKEGEPHRAGEQSDAVLHHCYHLEEGQTGWISVRVAEITTMKKVCVFPPAHAGKHCRSIIIVYVGQVEIS